MAQLLLKVRARMKGARTKDEKNRIAKRFLPWVTAEEFAKGPDAAIDDMIERTMAAYKAKKISGTTTEGEVITDEPFNHDGLGAMAKSATRGKLTRARFLTFLAKGITLAHQQEMQKLMTTKYGDPTKAKKAKGEETEDEETL